MITTFLYKQLFQTPGTCATQQIVLTKVCHISTRLRISTILLQCHYAWYGGLVSYTEYWYAPRLQY